ncbi:MAG: hypothetical protein R3200_11430 [Xanthomonadales bacterium]|nr:hypothetical protein [Xanthomonadales bacterium]
MRQTLLVFLATLMGTTACQPTDPTGEEPYAAKADEPLKSVAVLVTSEGGDRLSRYPDVAFRRLADPDPGEGTLIKVQPEVVKQTMLGVGTSFTESSAFVLAHLEPDRRLEVMRRVYGEEGANFSIARTPIGSTDFSVEGKYSYAPVAGDTALEHFTIAPDRAGFSRTTYPGVRDESYDVLPMIHEALAIKEQQDSEFRIVASAWTAPPWMKDIETWYIRGSEANDWEGTGGSLKPEYESTYADYLVRYLDAYAAEGVPIWGLTPVNEPAGNSGQWESMHFTPESQAEFIKSHLGPGLEAGGHGDVKLLIYDQNRDHLEEWAETILGDPEAAKYVYGTAVHWYASTTKVFEDTLQEVHERFPEFDIIHTEGTIDDLGKPAPGGIGDPEGFQESGWFGNDEFWWNENATDWAYTASWAPNAEDHPMYTPVHRYARNIIVSFNHWMSGWIDWNIVLNRDGGPNHVGNFCGAPIMIDTDTGEIYYTPIFHVLSQFSQTIRPGDRAVQVTRELSGLDPDALHASATINNEGLLSVQLLNTLKEPIEFGLQIGDHFADVTIPANAVQTIQVPL